LINLELVMITYSEAVILKTYFTNAYRNLNEEGTGNFSEFIFEMSYTSKKT